MGTSVPCGSLSLTLWTPENVVLSENLIYGINFEALKLNHPRMWEEWNSQYSGQGKLAGRKNNRRRKNKRRS